MKAKTSTSYFKMANIETLNNALSYALMVIGRRAISSFELKKNLRPEVFLKK